MEIKKYDKSKTNNDQQNEHTIIVPDMQDVLKQVEENMSNSVRDIFFFITKVQRKPTKEVIINLKVLNLSSVRLSPSQIHILSKGLKFSSTPQHNLPDIEKDIQILAENFDS